MSISKLIYLLFLISFITITNSCYYDSEQILYPNITSCKIVPSYKSEVSILINKSCASNGCHASGATNSGGALVNYSQIKAKAEVIKSTVVNGSMPKGATFSNEQIKLIKCWIENGAPNN